MRARGERMTDGNGDSESNRLLDQNKFTELQAIMDSRERYESPEIQYPELIAKKPDGISPLVFNYLQDIIVREIESRKENAAQGNDLLLNRSGQADWLIIDILPIKRALLVGDLAPAINFLDGQIAALVTEQETHKYEYAQRMTDMVLAHAQLMTSHAQRDAELRRIIMAANSNSVYLQALRDGDGAPQ